MTPHVRNTDAPHPPVLSPAQVLDIAHEFLRWTVADPARVYIQHRAAGMARVVLGHVRMQENGDSIIISSESRFGGRRNVHINTDQIDSRSIREAAEYLDRLGRQMPGDATNLTMPIPPRTYYPNTSWKVNTSNAFAEQRHAAVTALVAPVLDAGFTASGFVGVYAQTVGYVNKQGVAVAAEETDAEIVVTGWTGDGKGSGWAGQTARDWNLLNPATVAARSIELTRRSANPVAFEPGRHTVILDRPAVAQLVHKMAPAFDAESTIIGRTPLYNPKTQKPRLGERIMDRRIMLLSNPNDPDASYVPFTWDGDPMIPMTWIDHGVHTNLAFKADYAAGMGYSPSNYPPGAIRMQAIPSATLMTLDEMIASCKVGIFVNRFAYVGGGDGSTVGTLTGVTSGGCFLVRNGAIEKPIKNLRFDDSPWLGLNRLLAIGKSERAPFGYSPWSGGDWPVDPTVVPPLMIQDFNFTALADSA